MLVMKDIEHRFRSPEFNEAIKLMRELDARYFETLKTLYGAERFCPAAFTSGHEYEVA